MGKHKPKCLKDCDAQSHIIFKHFLDVCSCQELFFLSFTAFGLSLHISPCLSLWNSVTTPLSFKLQFLRPPLQKPSPEAISFLPEPLFTVAQPEPLLPMWCKEQPRLYRAGFGAVDTTEGPNYVSRAFVRDHHIPQHFH